MLKAAVCASILATLVGCGGSGSSSSEGNNSGGKGSSSGSSGTGGGTGSGAEDASNDDGASTDDSGIVNGNSWACPSSTVLGEYSSGCVSCIQSMCGPELQMCQTMACSICEGPTFSCEEQMCSSQCSPGGGGGSSSGSGTTTGDGGARVRAGRARAS